MEKVVLAYSGGLDTSVIIKYLNEKYNAEVITLTVDVGQQEDFKSIEEKAKSLGVLKHYTIDSKEEFLENYVLLAIKANALYQGKYPIHSALSRPLISKKLVEIAKKEDATTVAHGCTGKGNDQVRFEVTIKSLAPDLKIIAPIRDWKITRDQEIKYAKKHKIPVAAKRSVYSIDENLWGRAIECGELDYPEKEPPKDAFEWTVSPEEAPNKPEYVTIEFEEGIPIAVNGKKEDKITLISLLNKIAGKNGVGRVDHIEDRLVGIKSREVYEAPAALSIIEAHKDLEKLVLTRHELAFKEPVDTQWTWLAYSGLWLDPLKEDLEAFINNTQRRVSGEVKLKMYKGHSIVVGRSSPHSLYDLNLATYNIKTTFDQTMAEGFIELWGLPTKVANILKAKKKKT